jgi:hypothetical protein
MLVGFASSCYVRFHMSGISAQDLLQVSGIAWPKLADGWKGADCACVARSDSLVLQPAKG